MNFRGEFYHYEGVDILPKPLQRPHPHLGRRDPFINNRRRIPSAAFIRLARQAGVRFACGTNNAGADDLGDWSYPLEMQRKLDLKWTDMFVPGHGPSPAQRD